MEPTRPRGPLAKPTLGKPPPLPIAADEVAPGAIQTYREPSFHERPTPRPSRPEEDPPPMARPRTRTQTGMPAPPSERRPAISNPPPAEEATPRRRHHPHHEDEDIEEGERPSVVDFQRRVREGEVSAKYGKASFAGPAWAFVVLLVVGMLGAILYFVAKHQDAVPQNAATKNDVAAVDAKCESLHTDLAALAAKVNADSERQHNDMELLKLKVDVQRSK